MVSQLETGSKVETYLDRLICADARNIHTVIAPREAFVDVTITSPPYWNLKDYGVANQIGFGQDKETYLGDVRTVLDGCLKLTKDAGSLWLIVDTYRERGVLRLLPFELARLGEDVGWVLRDMIVWDKRYSLPWHAKGQMRDTVELVFFFTKASDYGFTFYGDRIKAIDELSRWWVDFPERFNPKGKTPTNIWSIPTRPRGTWRRSSGNDHYCSLPTALVARMIELTTDEGDVVLDPFAGSGIVLAQAAAMDRHFVGLELNDDYIALFHETVLGEVQSDWEGIEAWRGNQKYITRDFEGTVMRLRALKYARQVTRPFADSDLQTGGIRAVLCSADVPAEYHRRERFRVEVKVVVEAKSPELGDALKASIERALRPPLTTYGIESKISMCTIHEMQGDMIDAVYYLYPHYKPRAFTQKDTLRNWLEGARLEEAAVDGRIPMLANVPVDVAWVLDSSE